MQRVYLQSVEREATLLDVEGGVGFPRKRQRCARSPASNCLDSKRSR